MSDASACRRLARITSALIVSCTGGVVASGLLVLENGEVPGNLRIENTGPDISLSSKVLVERWRDGQWIETPIHMTVVEQCSPRPVPACVQLASGSVVKPVSWTGYTCSGQCPRSCRSNHFAGPGKFRFVVKSCEGSRVAVGPPFALVAKPR